MINKSLILCLWIYFIKVPMGMFNPEKFYSTFQHRPVTTESKHQSLDDEYSKTISVRVFIVI